MYISYIIYVYCIYILEQQTVRLSIHPSVSLSAHTYVCPFVRKQYEEKVEIVLLGIITEIIYLKQFDKKSKK